MDILLVLGSVTARQYSPLRKEMMDNGQHPNVIRITEDLQEVYDEFQIQVAQGPVTHQTHEDYVTEISLRFWHFICYKFHGLEPSNVKAIVFPKEDDLGDDTGSRRLLVNLMPAGIPVYTLLPLEGKSFSLVGYGYGSELYSD